MLLKLLLLLLYDCIIDELLHRFIPYLCGEKESFRSNSLYDCNGDDRNCSCNGNAGFDTTTAAAVDICWLESEFKTPILSS